MESLVTAILYKERTENQEKRKETTNPPNWSPLKTKRVGKHHYPTYNKKQARQTAN